MPNSTTTHHRRPGEVACALNTATSTMPFSLARFYENKWGSVQKCRKRQWQLIAGKTTTLYASASAKVQSLILRRCESLPLLEVTLTHVAATPKHAENQKTWLQKHARCFVASGDVEGAPRTCAGPDRCGARCYSVGHEKPDAHRYAGMFQGDLDLFRCISGTETFFF